MDALDSTVKKPQRISKGFIIAEIILFSLIIIGFLFNQLGFPGKAFFTIIGFGLYSILLFPIGLFYRYWQIKVINVLFSAIMLGIVFKIMIWPSFTEFLKVGTLMVPFVLLLFFMLYRKNKDFTAENPWITFRILFFSGISLLFFSLSPRTYYQTFVGNDAIAVELYEKMEEQPNDLKAYDAYTLYMKSKNGKFNIQDSTDVDTK